MRERPIPFSAPMVRALLDGSKTMTRRIVRVPAGMDRINDRALGAVQFAGASGLRWVRCPYTDTAGGGRLWVRETQRVIGRGPVSRRATQIRVRYEADGAESGLLPYPERLTGTPEIGKCLAYGGYRESSRLTLAVESVRVERLRDITDEDARAEGCRGFDGDGHRGYVSPRDQFERLWCGLNGDDSWDANPFVWVVSFRRLP